MYQNAHDTYLETQVLSASPIELVRMLCNAATGAVKNARTHLAAGDIAARARSINWASAILIELASSLDHERGAEISGNLVRLYDYMLRQLTAANIRQSDAPLQEVLGLLATLSEGWDGVQLPETPVPTPVYESSWKQRISQEAAMTASSHSWSL